MPSFDCELWNRPGIQSQRRRQVAQVMQAALDAVDPAEAVLRHLVRAGETLRVVGQDYDLSHFANVYVVGAGKAGAPMAQAVEQVLGERVTRGCINVKYGHRLPTQRVRLVEAGHPIPDAAGVAGATQIAALLGEAGADDLVICLISGGGSALMTLPEEGITLDDMRALTDALLRRGATINEINTLRKHLERMKGGRLARLAQPATVISLVLSDVVGNPLDVIASGPTVPDGSTFEQAWQLLERYRLTTEAPAAIVERLRRGAARQIEDTPKAGDPAFDRVQTVVVGSNEIAALAAEERARQSGFSTMLLSTYLEGEAREVAKVLAAIAKEIQHSGRPAPRPACVIAGGETTVTLRGAGRGGRNQEMALQAALSIAGLEGAMIACLATDGSDGPTDASGALAEGDTVARGHALGLDALGCLDANDSYTYFAALGDLLITGPTNTNVNDLSFVFVW